MKTTKLQPLKKFLLTSTTLHSERQKLHILFWVQQEVNMTSQLLLYQIYDLIGIGAWQTVYAMLFKFFNDITNWNSFNGNFSFS